MHGPFMIDIMVHAMESFPEAGYGLFDHGPHKPLFPILLKPEEAYEAHYTNKHSIFDRSPLNAIIKKDAFDTVGGFSGNQHVGDFELWHHLSAKYSTVVMSPEPGYWRKHDDQQSSDNRTDSLVPFKYQLLSIKIIESDTCPLVGQVKTSISRELLRRQSRTILSSILRYGIRDSLRLKKASNLSWKKIVSTAFSISASEK